MGTHLTSVLKFGTRAPYPTPGKILPCEIIIDSVSLARDLPQLRFLNVSSASRRLTNMLDRDARMLKDLREVLCFKK